jgi:putative alpha-1,2-mannosidase
VLNLPSGKRFTIEAPGLSATNRYVGQVTLNGAPLERSFVRHGEIVAGGTLRFEMAAVPDTRWATAETARPYSATGYSARARR